jgi:hypothetical protein
MNKVMLHKSKNQNRGGSLTNSKSQKGNQNMEKLNKSQQKALFATAFEHDNAITKHEQEIEALTVKRSDAVKAIFDAMGKGPFQVGERFVTIRSRKGQEPIVDEDGSPVIDEETGKAAKKPTGKSVYFFVNAGDNVTVI